MPHTTSAFQKAASFAFCIEFVATVVVVFVFVFVIHVNLSAVVLWLWQLLPLCPFAPACPSLPLLPVANGNLGKLKAKGEQWQQES